jgi:hypothetical protein
MNIKLLGGYWLIWLLSFWSWLSSCVIIRQRDEILYQWFDYQVIWHYHLIINDSDMWNVYNKKRLSPFFILLKINRLKNTTGRMYDKFIRLLFFHTHRETSVLTNELSEESDQFRFLRVSCFANMKGTVGLIMTKTSTIWISIPLVPSSRTFIPLPHFIRSCRPTPFLDPSLVLFPPCSARVIDPECLFLTFHWVHYSS